MTRLLWALLLLGTATPASAHLDPHAHGSFAAGLTHPLSGLDHVLAMFAVGLWAALLGGRAVWLVPGAFVGTMLVGFAAALGGVALPFVEPTVAASVIILGLLVALALRVPAPAGMTIVAVFALFHGAAHGGELGAAGALPFALGFALATAALHAGGVALGLGLSRWRRGPGGGVVARVAGAATACAGLWLVVGA